MDVGHAVAQLVVALCFNALHCAALRCTALRCTALRCTALRCAPNRKVADSIPEGVNGIFNCHNPSGRTMALGLTQSLTEISTRNISFR
jgi:hypothetical protein